MDVHTVKPDEFDSAYGPLFRELRVLCRALGATSDADDIAQDVLLYGRAHLSQLRDDTKLRPWLGRMAIRLVGRRRAARVQVADDKKMVYAPGHPELGIDMAAAIAELPPRERLAVTLVYGLGFHQEEAAQLLGVRRGTIAALLWRSRDRLAHALRDYREASR